MSRETAPAERWVSIPNMSGYEVSDAGNIRSVERIVLRSSNRGSITVKPRMLRLQTSKNGYIRVVVRVDGKHKLLLPHRAVAMAFCPGYDTRKQVNHIDGDKANNRYTNLVWCTPAENCSHAVAVLKQRIGDKNHNARLSEKDVKVIRKRVANGEHQSVVANDFSITTSHANRIWLRKSWRHVV